MCPDLSAEPAAPAASQPYAPFSTRIAFVAC